MLRDHVHTETREVFHTDRMAVPRNVAANGRLFCGLNAAIMAYTGHPVLALLAIVPIGASCIVDQLPNGKARLIGSLTTYAIAAVVLIFSLAAML